jgi:hypothetical protein
MASGVAACFCGSPCRISDRACGYSVRVAFQRLTRCMGEDPRWESKWGWEQRSLLD